MTCARRLRSPYRLLPLPRCVPLAFLLAGGQAVLAQGAGDARPVTVVPNAAITQTLTDNASLDERKRADAITLLSAGVSVASRGSQVRGFLDYQLTGSVHARESHENNLTNALRAAVNSELVDNWLFLDANASISQQTISAFGSQTRDPAIDNPNRTEVRSIAVVPSVRGQIGAWTAYDLRWNYARQSTSASTLGDTTDNAVSATLRSTAPGRFGWQLAASHQRTEYRGGETATTDVLRGTATVQAMSDLQLSVSAGKEKTDVVSSTRETDTTWGVGLVWSPSERTRLSAQRDRRPFGNAHALSFEHRTARTTWRLISSRDISTSAPRLATDSVALYDLLFASLAAAIPDPIARRDAVLAELRRQGRDPNEALTVGFLQSSVALLSRQEFGMAYAGLRTSMTLSLSRNDTRTLDSGARADDLGLSNRVRQTSLNTTVSHRLTPSSSLSLLYSELHTRGANSAQRNETRTVSLNWNAQLGVRSNVSLGVRHVEFESLSPYVENAVYATLGVRF